MILLKVLVVLVIGIATVLVGSPLVKLLFRLVDRTEGRRAIDAPTPDGTGGPVPAVPAVGSIQAAESQLRGGYWIGVLERAAIFAAILTGYGSGLAVILGVKSLARYPELRAEENRGAAERFIIGTFASSLIAGAGAGLTLWIISLW
ncbi:MAG: hypothetical protein ACOH16_09450 [Propionibacteriaceae bacterium]